MSLEAGSVALYARGGTCCSDAALLKCCCTGRALELSPPENAANGDVASWVSVLDVDLALRWTDLSSSESLPASRCAASCRFEYHKYQLIAVVPGSAATMPSLQYAWGHDGNTGAKTHLYMGQDG